MIVPDANLLLYATDEKSPFFEPAHAWWSECLNGSEPIGLCHAVLFAFLRISTNARVYIAAIALAHRAEVHTADQDFRRFPDVHCRYPLAA